MARSIINPDMTRRALVEVAGPPLTAAGLCALLKTLPEVATAIVTENNTAESRNKTSSNPHFSARHGKVRLKYPTALHLVLHIGNEESHSSHSLPFAMPSGEWVLIYPYNAFDNIFGAVRSQKKAVAGMAGECPQCPQQPQRHWNGEHAVIGLHDSVDTLRNALRAVAQGTSYYSPCCVIPGQALPGLSARQREVALLAAAGLSNAEIAQHLFVDITTVKTHLTEVYRKTGIRRRSQIVGQIGV